MVGGTLPRLALGIVRPAQEGRADAATAESQRLAPLWNLFTEFGGSLRVVAAIAEHLGLAQHKSLPLPIQGLTKASELALLKWYTPWTWPNSVRGRRTFTAGLPLPPQRDAAGNPPSGFPQGTATEW